MIEWKNISLIQVEALKECFDLIENGYIDRKSYFGDSIWLIYLIHAYNHNEIRMEVHKDRYSIRKNDRLIKTVSGCNNRTLYHAWLNSQGRVKAVRVRRSDCLQLVSGYVLPNGNEE